MPSTSKRKSPLKLDPWRLFPHTFAERMSEGRWKPFNYLKEISLEIAGAVACGGGLILVSLPPRHGKSEFISVWTPAWFIDQFPKENVILASYAAEFAASWGRRVRNEILFNPLSNVKISSDSSAADRWNTIQGGGMMTAGVGGQIVGKGGKLLIIDDPTKNWEEALSKTFQEKTINWFKSVFWTRREPGSLVILLMQRWTENDLYGWIKANSKELELPITEFCFPAIAEAPDILGRKEGQALCPERYDEKALASVKVFQGDHMFSAIYQQAPRALGGNIIKGKNFVRYKVPPKIKYRKIFADTAQKTSERNDYSVFEEWGLGEDGKIYLLDMIRSRWEAPELQRRSIEFWNKGKSRDVTKFGTLREMKVEDKASGTGLIQTIKLPPFNIPVKPIERNKDKLTRVLDALPYIEVGFVCVPEEASFTSDFISECEAFSSDDSHAFDDQIDPLTDAIQDMLQSGNKLKTWEALGQSQPS